MTDIPGASNAPATPHASNTPSPPGTQRRGRRIMMTPEERDAYLREQRTCRVATIGSDGAPHIGALWFLWDGGSLWLYSITRSLRWSHLLKDPRIAVVVDDGEGYGELRGVELTGRVEFIGEAPRTGEPCPELTGPEGLFRSSTSASRRCRTTGGTPGCGSLRRRSLPGTSANSPTSPDTGPPTTRGTPKHPDARVRKVPARARTGPQETPGPAHPRQP